MLFHPALGIGSVGRWAGALDGRQGGLGNQCAEMGGKGAKSPILSTMCTDASLPVCQPEPCVSNSRLLPSSSPHHVGVSAEVFVSDFNKTTGIYSFNQHMR